MGHPSLGRSSEEELVRHPSAIVALSLLALVGASAAPSRSTTHEPAAVLAVAPADARPGRPSGTFLALLFGEDGPIPASVTVLVPRGYRLDLSRPPGERVGMGAALLRQSFFAGQLRRVPVVVDDPARYLLDAKAQDCAPGLHAAAWLAPLPLGLDLGTLTVVFFVDPASPDSLDAAYRITACLPSPELPPAEGGLAGGKRLLGLGLDLEGMLVNPAAGTHVWRLLVLPYAPGSHSSDVDATFEARALVLLPQSLSARARYLPRARSLLVQGRLLALGTGRGGAHVTIAKESGVQLGTATTKKDGTFTVRARIAQTARLQRLQLVADVALETRPCTDPPIVAGGCAAEAVAPPPTLSFAATIPKLPTPGKAVGRRGR
ncbi:MAG: hypothetical protein C4306_03975 [Thermoleophilia bacterium]